MVKRKLMAVSLRGGRGVKVRERRKNRVSRTNLGFGRARPGGIFKAFKKAKKGT